MNKNTSDWKNIHLWAVPSGWTTTKTWLKVQFHTHTERDNCIKVGQSLHSAVKFCRWQAGTYRDSEKITLVKVIAFSYIATSLVNCTLTTTVFNINRNLSTLQMLWKIMTSVCTYFHCFDIKFPARGIFFLYFVYNGQTSCIKWCCEPNI